MERRLSVGNDSLSIVCWISGIIIRKSRELQKTAKLEIMTENESNTNVTL